MEEKQKLLEIIKNSMNDLSKHINFSKSIGEISPNIPPYKQASLEFLLSTEKIINQIRIYNSLYGESQELEGISYFLEMISKSFQDNLNSALSQIPIYKKTIIEYEQKLKSLSTKPV